MACCARYIAHEPIHQPGSAKCDGRMQTIDKHDVWVYNNKYSSLIQLASGHSQKGLTVGLSWL